MAPASSHAGGIKSVSAQQTSNIYIWEAMPIYMSLFLVALYKSGIQGPIIQN